MQGFFQARSVAVVGVSGSPTNLGRAMAYNLMEFGYDGCIHLVGPRGGTFLGHRIHPTVLDVPEPVDLATVLVPARAVPEVLDQCGRKGIRRVVLQSAGFREMGEDRQGLEKEVLAILETYDMRMIGPNCIGVMSRPNGLAVPFMPMKAEAPPGSVSIVSQSGGVGAMMVNLLGGEHLGFCRFASIGNKLDVNESHLLEYLLEDEETRVVFLYLEGVADGRGLMEILQGASKPVVVHKSNTGRSGAGIARSHSASLSTDDQVVDAALSQCGALRVKEQRLALEALKAFLLPAVKGSRLAVVSRSGGHAVMAADAAEDHGFELPPYPPRVTEAVREHSRAKVIRSRNPLDLGDLFDLPLYHTLAEETLARDDIDALLFVHNYQGVFDAEESYLLVKRLAELGRRLDKPLALCVFTPASHLDRNRRDTGFPVFADPAEAVRALALNRDWHARKVFPFPTRRPAGVETEKAAALLEGAGDGQVDPGVLARVLEAYSIPLQPWAVASSVEEAWAAAGRLGLPAALKTAEPEILHKSDAGGVKLGLRDRAEVERAYGELRELGPRVLVQKMAGPGVEWLAGGRRDETFGPVVVSGLGGTYVEVFRETRIAAAPLAREEAARLLDRSRGAALLAGARGEAPADRRALEDVVERVSWLLHDFPCLAELDLNPVRVSPSGCSVLDWRARKQKGKNLT